MSNTPTTDTHSNTIYTWKFLPTSQVDELIVYGYHRNHWNKTGITSVLQIIESYLQYDQTLIYEHTLHHIKATTSDETYFESAIFMMNESYPFYLRLYPTNNNSELEVRIYLAAFPNGINEVKFNFKLYIKEIDASSINTAIFKDTADGKWDIFKFTDLKLNDINDLNKLTFCLIKQNEKKSRLTQLIQMPIANYKWYIPKKSNDALDENEHFVSSAFFDGCFEWNMRLHKSWSERRRDLYLHLASLSSDISEILIQYRVWIGNADTQHKFSDCIAFNNYTMTHILGKNVEISDEIIIYIELCVYRASPENKVTITMSNSTATEMKPYYCQYCSWHISSSSRNDLICHGFVRKYAYNNKYIADNVMKNVAQTIKCFLQFDGTITLNHIKNAKLNESFDSPIFMKGKLKLYLKVTPNLDGKFIIQVYPLINCADINRNFKICFKEINAECVQVIILKKNYNTTFALEGIDINNIEHLHQLTIQLLYDSKKNISSSKTIELPSGAYKWNVTNPIYIQAITSAKQNQFIVSPQFSYGPCKWQIKLYPKADDDSKVWLHLYSTPMPSEIKNIIIKCELLLKETNSIFLSDALEFNKNQMKSKLSGKIFSEIKNIKTLTVVVKIFIYHIEYYDKDSNERFYLGDTIYAKDKREHWCPATVIDIKEDKIKIHYDGWEDKFDEYIEINSDRLKSQMFEKLVMSPDVTMTKFTESDTQLLEVKTENLKAEYVWEISNMETMKRIKNASNSFGFKSKIFKACSLKWLLTMYPNGKSQEMEDTIQVSLLLLSLSSEDLSVCVTYTIQIVEIDYNWTQELSVNHNENGIVLSIPSPPRKTILNLESLSIKLQIQNIHIYENENIDVTHHFVTENNKECKNISGIKPEIFTWNIPDSLVENTMSDYKFNHEYFRMYCTDWYITVCPGKRQIHLTEQRPSKRRSSMRFYVLCTFTIVEHKINHIFNAKFKGDSFKWNHDLSLELENCTIKLEMELIDVYSDSHNWTSHYFERLDDTKTIISKLTKNINTMAKNFNKYDERLNKCTETMNNIMKVMNNMVDNNCMCICNKYGDTEINDLKLWLNNDVKLGQYYSLFIKNGIDNLDTVKLIGKNELDVIGITLIGHRLKLLHHIELLNRDIDNSNSIHPS